MKILIIGLFKKRRFQQNYDFDKLLQVCFNTCQVLGEIKALGENIDDAIDIEIDYLNNLLLKSELSLEEREEIINKAYSLMGIDNVFKIKRSR